MAEDNNNDIIFFCLCYVLDVDVDRCDCDLLSASLCCSSLLCGWVSRN